MCQIPRKNLPLAASRAGYDHSPGNLQNSADIEVERTADKERER
jgi:hypothetical protein